jgi:hypothetical protein
MTTSVHKLFADNLFALSAKRGSIAEVCRRSLPSAPIMQKLSHFFEVPQLTFFAEQENHREETPQYGGFDPSLGKLNASGNIQGAECELPEGLYTVYAPWLTNPAKIVRYTLLLKNRIGRTHFTRIIRRRKQDEPDGVSNYGRLDGIALQNNSQLTLIGRENRHWDHFFSVVSINTRNRLAPNMWPGIASTFLPTGLPAALALLIEKRPEGTSLRQALRYGGIIEAGSAELPKDVASFFDGWTRSANLSLHCPDSLKPWRH